MIPWYVICVVPRRTRVFVARGVPSSSSDTKHHTSVRHSFVYKRKHYELIKHPLLYPYFRTWRVNTAKKKTSGLYEDAAAQTQKHHTVSRTILFSVQQKRTNTALLGTRYEKIYTSKYLPISGHGGWKCRNKLRGFGRKNWLDSMKTARDVWVEARMRACALARYRAVRRARETRGARPYSHRPTSSHQ